MTARSSFVFFGLQVALAKLRGVFALIILLQYEVKSKYG